jgi:hypothetical protein
VGEETDSKDADLTEIPYAEAVRSIELQARGLDELRSRTGVLLAASSVTTSFLGAASLDESGFDTLAALAMIAFAVSVGVCLAILWPKSDWRFALGARTMLEDWDRGSYPDSKSMRRFVAEKHHDNWKSNKAKLDAYYAHFRWAVIALGVAVLLWLVKLA